MYTDFLRGQESCPRSKGYAHFAFRSWLTRDGLGHTMQCLPIGCPSPSPQRRRWQAVPEGIFLSRVSLYKATFPLVSKLQESDMRHPENLHFFAQRGSQQRHCYLLPGLPQHSNTISAWKLEVMMFLCCGTCNIERFPERNRIVGRLKQWLIPLNWSVCTRPTAMIILSTGRFLPISWLKANFGASLWCMPKISLPFRCFANLKDGIFTLADVCRMLKHSSAFLMGLWCISIQENEGVTTSGVPRNSLCIH